MKILVFGAGAIGAYLGGSLALAGHAVTFIVRPARVAQWQGGLRLKDAKGSEQLARGLGLASSVADALARGPYDVLLFALKSVDTASAINEIRTATATPPPILCLQNGVDNEGDLAQVFGAERVIAGTVTTAVSKPAESEIVVERKRGVGVAANHPLSGTLLTAFNQAQLNAHSYADPLAMKWSKLLTNLLGNATAAILDLSVSEVFADARLFQVEMLMLRECLSVMRAQNHAVVDLPSTPVRLLAFGAQHLPLWLAQPLVGGSASGGRGRKRPSLHMDLHNGRGRTEVRWLHGAVARHGHAAGVPTPVCQVLADTVEGLSAGRLKPETFRHKPDVFLRLIKS